MSLARGKGARLDLLLSSDLYETPGIMGWVIIMVSYNHACIFLYGDRVYAPYAMSISSVVTRPPSLWCLFFSEPRERGGRSKTLKF